MLTCSVNGPQQSIGCHRGDNQFQSVLINVSLTPRWRIRCPEWDTPTGSTRSSWRKTTFTNRRKSVSCSPARERDRWVTWKHGSCSVSDHRRSWFTVNWSPSPPGGASASGSGPSRWHWGLWTAAQTSATCRSHQHQTQEGLARGGQPGRVSRCGAHTVLEGDPGATASHWEHKGDSFFLKLYLYINS